MRFSRIGLKALSLFTFVLLPAGAAAAQARPDGYPGRSIRIIVPFPAGGPTDVALSDRAVATTAKAAGVDPAASTPAEFAAFIRHEADRWSKVLPETGMRFD